MKNIINIFKTKGNAKKFKNTKLCITLILLLFFYIFISAYSYSKSVSYDLCDSIFRLHVLANSNSKEDQDLKYLVRDNLIKYMNTICANTKNKDEAISIANSHLSDFQQIAIDTIRKEGCNYDVLVEIGNFNFPTKTYGDISFPSGYYDALRVKIGKAEGQNWWCVMFPPLCFVDISSGIVPDNSKDLINNELHSDEEFNLISSNSSFDIKFKFKILEFFNNSGILSAHNK